MFPPDEEKLIEEVRKLKKRLARERAARLEAESIAEHGLRQLYEKKEQLQLLGAVAVAANESATVDELLQLTLNKICATSRWQLGHAYLVRQKGNEFHLISSGIWSEINCGWMEEFQLATRVIEKPVMGGLPDRTLTMGEPIWVADTTEDTGYPESEMRRLEGTKSAFAIPVRAGDQVAAVLEFVSEQFIALDEFFLQLMAQIATQIGRLLDRKRAESQLIHDASHDSLTKLPNRALFMDRLTRALARNKRIPHVSFAVLFIDLDRFKMVNDTLGHNAGDELLIQVVARISAALRHEEMIARCGADEEGNRETLARLGGDEFTVLLDEIRDPSQALRVADRIQKTLADSFRLGGNDVSVCASIGIAISGTAYDTPSEIIRDADLAMYRAKSLGGSRYVIYDESMQALGASRLQMETDLRSALKNDEFVLHYQPIVELKTSEIVGFEALVRWRSRPDSELIYPDQFIKIAEDSGLIVPIGAWVLRQACSVMCTLQQEFPRERPLTINVNLSSRQFSQLDLVHQIGRVVSETCILPGTLGLEITESVTMDDTDRTAAVVAELASAGVHVSIDDFGTGFSSLSYLHRFPIHVLKIDRSFTGRIDFDAESLAIVRTIANLARDLGMDVVAEGVETKAQAARLKSLDCKFGQGYFYSPPLDETSVRRLLHSQEMPMPHPRAR
ncbi:putative signal transduction protein with EAL and GGDEF domain [Granulicella aggregans]|uniref:Putative signal transduction protein with EAL and GGDEF domain n=1 Tax=Granulicella aggregans TaxID=474949 RepID=A0A7W8E5S1_9BACT|nr:bifunctional diguanylate cyclase/phosphodiesterase [Granulicella aggregans]MBB5059911.1 putative signal transduction protein with EAL and GGDEF domain [Granulicella aggregans]